MGKAVALFLVVVPIIIIVYTVSHLSEYREDAWIAWLVIIANAICVIWNLGVLGKRR